MLTRAWAARVTSLITKFDHRLAQRIQAAVQAGEPLDQLSGEPEHVYRRGPPAQRAASSVHVCSPLAQPGALETSPAACCLHCAPDQPSKLHAWAHKPYRRAHCKSSCPNP